MPSNALEREWLRASSSATLGARAGEDPHVNKGPTPREKALLDATNDVVVELDLTGRIVLVNRACSAWLRVEPEQAVGLDWFEEFVDESQRKPSRARFEALMREGSGEDSEELCVVSRDGERIASVWRLRALRSADGSVVGRLGVGHGQAALDEAATAARESEDRFRLLFDKATDGILVADAESRKFVAVNASMARMLRASPQGVLRLGVGDIHPREDLARVAEAFEALVRGDTTSAHDLPILRQDGTVFYADISAGAVTLGGRPALVGIFRDITEQKRQAEERRNMELRVAEAEKLESLGVLAGGIAHDFNNLLVGIIGNAELVKTEFPALEQRDSFQGIEVAAQRAAELCRQMLAYSGRAPRVVADVDLGLLVKEMAQLLKASIPKRVILRFDLPSTLPSVSVDPTQMRQLVMNLITNAAEAIGDAPGVIDVRAGVRHFTREELDRATPFGALEPGLCAFFEVTDTGSGMTEETQRRLFEPFFSTKVKGRGLGMVGVVGAVRTLRGGIIIRTELGRGTSFNVVFPAGRGAAPEFKAAAPARREARFEGTVLVADDESIVLSVARRMLQKLGLDVLTASNGVDAVAVFADHAQQIRFVLLDVTMPRMGGADALQHMRAIRSDVPALLSSGYDVREAMADLEHLERVGFVQKPYQLDLLSEQIRTLLA